MRWLALYLRSRFVPLAVLVPVGATLLLWWLGSLSDDARVQQTLALLAVLAGWAAAGSGLAGQDADLDRTAAIAWPPRRAAHVVAAGLLIIGLMALVHPGPVVRNVIGMGGLVALGAATLRASWAPLLPVTWTLLVLPSTPPLGVPPAGPTYKVMLTWLVQPAATGPATAVAIVLGVAGVVMYAIRGSR